METEVIRAITGAVDSVKAAIRKTNNGFVSDYLAVALQDLGNAIKHAADTEVGAEHT